VFDPARQVLRARLDAVAVPAALAMPVVAPCAERDRELSGASSCSRCDFLIRFAMRHSSGGRLAGRSVGG